MFPHADIALTTLLALAGGNSWTEFPLAAAESGPPHATLAPRDRPGGAPAKTSGPVGLTLKQVLQTKTTLVGQPIAFPQQDAQITAVIAEVAPGGQVGRHMHPVPLFVYILEGTLTIDMESHGVHTFKAGDGFAEVINSWHNGRNLTDKPVRFLIVFAGQEGTPNLIRPSDASTETRR